MSDHINLNPLIKHLYVSDAVFHCMIITHAEENEQIPHTSMLLLNEANIIGRLAKVSEMKRMYHNMIITLLHGDPFLNWEDDTMFKKLNNSYDQWAHKLEEIVREKLYSEQEE